MTQISSDDVQYLAQLSNLQLPDQEVESLRADLDAIIGYIHQLSELDTEGVEPTYQVTGLENVWRDDEINNYGVDRETLLSRAPETDGTSIKVPKVL
jgi:aspartyl-tRNA(Asn)/glutamyl-tRNA(Gln) amidotransferase subunit C